MRTLAITQNVTLDGSIEMLDDWFEPQGADGVDNSDLIAEVHRQDEAADSLLLGRRTFVDMRGYWPHQRGKDATGVSEYLDRMEKLVVTSTLTDAAWQNTVLVSADPVSFVRGIKAGTGKDIVVTGSIGLCHALIAAGLVDEYRLFTYPIVQGRGRRLFPDGYHQRELHTLEAKAFRSGIVYTRFGQR